MLQVPFRCRVGSEAFLAPEVLLGSSPGKAALPLPRLVDEVVCACPIDSRRALYRNIVLCVSALLQLTTWR